MALKGDRSENVTYIDWFMNEVAERGGIVSVSTAGSGVGMDQAAQLCTYDATPSGAIPLGFLLNDMVNLDLTRQKLNPYKNEVQIGGKVTVMTQGQVVTNLIQPGITPSAGDKAYLHASGYISNTNHLDHSNNTIGRFVTRKDQHGYARVEVLLPKH